MRKIGSRNTPQQQNQVKNSNDGSMTVNVYKHLLTGDIIPISPDYKVIGKQSEKIQKLLKNANIRKLINEGILIKMGSKIHRPNPAQHQNINEILVTVFR